MKYFRDSIAPEREPERYSSNILSLLLVHGASSMAHFLRRTIGLLSVLAMFLAGGSAQGYTPDSPEVKAAIEKGLKYLETQFKEEYRLGGKCLIGMCFWKNGRPIDHAMIQGAIKACRDSVGENHNENYNPALAAIFLCELEDQQPQLRDLAQTYLDKLLKKQKPHGGWGYDSMATGDTSQTQYAALALWIAAHHGHQIPQDAVEKLCGWLVRTQDPSGTWAYQGTDPGHYQRVAQGLEVRLSLHVGGAASTYITADLLGITQAAQGPAPERTIPPALRAVGEKEEKKPRRKLGPLTLFDAQLVRRAIADGDRYFTQNYTISPKMQLHYYLYGLERYQSFKELAANKAESEPKWYNEGCQLLLSSQNQTGLWAATGDNHSTSTSFAILFLCRSSHKSIANIVPSLGGGVLLGGMGLPPNTADIVERDGKVVETPLAGSIEELLALIEKPNPELDQLVDARKPLALDSDVTKRAGQVTALRSIVSAGDFNARLLAVRTLGRARELDNVPILIHALSDPISPTNPDYRIVLEADRGLRFLSRKFEGVGLPEQPSAGDIQAAIRAWKEWYKSVRPDAEFLD